MTWMELCRPCVEQMQLALVLQLYRCVQGPASATVFGSELPGCTVWVTA